MKRPVAISLLLAFVLYGLWHTKGQSLDDSDNNTNQIPVHEATVDKKPPSPSVSPPQSGTTKLTVFHTIFTEKRSGHWMEAKVSVVKLIPDDTHGDPHQRFIVRGADDITVLVAHNIALAKRVPVQPAMTISLRGRYEWNPKGGVLHWTHRDPSGQREGGWIEVNGTRYR